LRKLKFAYIAIGCLLLTGCGSLAPDAQEESVSESQRQAAIEEENQAMEHRTVFDIQAADLDQKLADSSLFVLVPDGVEADDGFITVDYAAGEESRDLYFSAIMIQINESYRNFGEKKQLIDEAMTALFKALGVEFDYSDFEKKLESREVNIDYGEKIHVEITQNTDDVRNVQLIIKPN